MRIDWAIPCRYVEISPEGLATIVGAGMNAFWLPGFPGGVGLMIALKLSAAEDDQGEHALGSHVLGPDMSEVNPRVTAEFTMGAPNPLKPPGWEQNMYIPAGIQFPTPEPGQYTVVMSVDDRTASVPLMVQPAQPPA